MTAPAFAPASPLPAGVTMADASPLPWDGNDGDLGLPGRRPVAVSQPVRDYVVAEKALAARMGEPASARLRGFLSALGAAAEGPRAALEKVKAAEERARDARLSTDEAAAMSGLAAVERHHARKNLRAAVEAKAAEYDAWLAREEADAAGRLGSLESRTPRPEDVSFASELASSLRLMPPAVAAPVVRQWLVAAAVNAPDGAGRTAALRRASALLPVVRGLAATDKAWSGSHEVAQVLREADAVAQDRDFYAAHARLAFVARERALLPHRVRAFIEGDGAPDAPGLRAHAIGRDGTHTPLLEAVGAVLVGAA